VLILKAEPWEKDEMKFIFDVTKCDKLFDVLLQNKVIQLSENHVVPSAAQLAKGKYCKWHGTFSHMTNECNYFRRQVQAALNVGPLTLGDGHHMKLDTDPFPANVNTIKFEEVKVLVHLEQADSMRGKNIIVSDEPRPRMLKPRSPEPGVWKVNQRWWTGWRRTSVFQRLGYRKRGRSPEWEDTSRHHPETARWTTREVVDTRVQGFYTKPRTDDRTAGVRAREEQMGDGTN
jgi:hypothetical protein